MKTEDILNLDYRVEENRELLTKVLRKIPPLAEYDEIPLEALEKVIGSISRKYAIMIQYICPTYVKGNEPIYCVSLKIIYPYRWLGNVYGCCLYEVMAKTAIRMYAEVRKGTLKLLSECTNERRRADEIANLH